MFNLKDTLLSKISSMITNKKLVPATASIAYECDGCTGCSGCTGSCSDSCQNSCDGYCQWGCGKNNASS